MSGLLSLPEGVEYRLANTADNAAILEFLDHQPMHGELQLRFDRRPDFFALPNAHDPRNETWILLRQRRVRATASFVLRDGYIGGTAEPVFYLGDLRVCHDRKIAGLWRGLAEQRLDRLCAETGARFGYCAIIRDNRLARSSILRHRRGNRLYFTHLRGYSTVSIIARKPVVRRRRHSFEIRRATPGDSDMLRRFADRESRLQPFGTVFDEQTWRRHIEHWPGLQLEDFWLAFDAAGELAGCVAPWDYSALKKIVIDALPASVRMLRLAYNLLTPLTGKPRLTGAHSTRLPDIALSHVFIRDRQPAVFAALLDRVYRDIARSRRYATVSLCLFDDDPLWPALDRYFHYAVPMDLYSVYLAENEAQAPKAVTQTPGFEICLV